MKKSIKNKKNKTDKKIIFLLTVLICFLLWNLASFMIKSDDLLKDFGNCRTNFTNSFFELSANSFQVIEKIGNFTTNLYISDIKIISYSVKSIHQIIGDIGEFPILALDFVINSIYVKFEDQFVSFDSKNVEKYLGDVSAGYKYATSNLNIKESNLDNVFNKINFNYSGFLGRTFENYIFFVANASNSLTDTFKRGLNSFSFGLVNSTQTFSNNLTNNLNFLGKQFGNLRADITSGFENIRNLFQNGICIGGYK